MKEIGKIDQGKVVLEKVPQVLYLQNSVFGTKILTMN